MDTTSHDQLIELSTQEVDQGTLRVFDTEYEETLQHLDLIFAQERSTNLD